MDVENFLGSIEDLEEILGDDEAKPVERAKPTSQSTPEPVSPNPDAGLPDAFNPFIPQGQPQTPLPQGPQPQPASHQPAPQIPPMPQPQTSGPQYSQTPHQGYNQLPSIGQPGQTAREAFNIDNAKQYEIINNVLTMTLQELIRKEESGMLDEQDRFIRSDFFYWTMNTARDNNIKINDVLLDRFGEWISRYDVMDIHEYKQFVETRCGGIGWVDGMINRMYGDRGLNEVYNGNLEEIMRAKGLL